MDKIKLYKIKYKRKIILLGYCNYENFGQYVISKGNSIVICMNNNYSDKRKSRLLHKTLKDI